MPSILNRKLKLYLLELRAPFFTASIVPVVLGTAIAWSSEGTFHLVYFSLTLVGAVLIHAGINVSNDYFDHISGNDDINVSFVRPFTGGSRMIQKGLLRPREVLSEALVLLSLGIAIGLYLSSVRGMLILVFGIIGIITGFFYTAPPLNIVGRGFGEVFVGLDFGVLIVAGSYYVQTGHLSPEPFIASVPVALLIAAVLYINEFQDYDADRATGKHNIVVRLGKKRASLGYVCMISAAYVAIAISVVLSAISPFVLIALFSLPISLKGIITALRYYDDNLRLVPANAATVMSHLLLGTLMAVGYIAEGFISRL